LVIETIVFLTTSILQLDQFDDQGDLVTSFSKPNAPAKRSRNEGYQKQFVEEIRNSTCFFKVN